MPAAYEELTGCWRELEEDARKIKVVYSDVEKQ